MEIHKLTSSACKEAAVAARAVSEQTGKSRLYHFVDAIVSYVRHGCSSRQYSTGGFYKYRPFERKNVYTGGRSYMVKAAFNRKADLHLLDDKIDFNTFFAEEIKREWISCKTASISEVEAFVAAHDALVVKPADGMKGSGVHVFDKSELTGLAGSNVILEECISRHPALIFNNKSVNTIRLITVRDSNGLVHFVKAGLRCGVGESFVDNLSAGGVAYPVDVKRGFIEEPGVNGSYSLGKKDYVFIHPGTDIFMLGYQIPFWKETLELVESAALKLENIRFVGWDIAITPDGPSLVEGNSRPGPSIIEEMGRERCFYRTIMSWK